MNTDQLAVWLYGTKVALVSRDRERLSLAYTEEALGRYPLGSPLLSLSLPLNSERHPNGKVRAFLDGLLPEGETRQVIANDLGLRREDTYGLIAAIGRECAGAVVIQPVDAPMPPPSTTLTAEPLDDAEIDDLVRNLRDAPLGIGNRVRISLAGVQEKLLLTRMPDGQWGRPVDETPSTHILKPEIARFPGIVENEAFCMRLAGHLDLEVPTVETATYGGRRLVIVERYDRQVHADGSLDRIHQEDFCQATATSPERKYQGDDGPSLRRIADIVQIAAAPLDSLERLLRVVTLNAAIGNGDAHAKNFSLLYDPPGSLRLAPCYDLLCSAVYLENEYFAMSIDSVWRVDRVTTDRIVREAKGWGMSERVARDVVHDLLGRLPEAVEAARDETEGVSQDVLAFIDTQLSRL